MIYKRQSGTFQVEEDLFSKSAEGINETHHKVILLLKILQTKP